MHISFLPLASFALAPVLAFPRPSEDQLSKSFQKWHISGNPTGSAPQITPGGWVPGHGGEHPYGSMGRGIGSLQDGPARMHHQQGQQHPRMIPSGDNPGVQPPTSFHTPASSLPQGTKPPFRLGYVFTVVLREPSNPNVGHTLPNTWGQGQGPAQLGRGSKKSKTGGRGRSRRQYQQPSDQHGSMGMRMQPLDRVRQRQPLETEESQPQ